MSSLGGSTPGPRSTDPTDDAGWNREARHETPTERLDRNWSDLLQELRVVQTGVQLLTGFLLTLPFQARFAELDAFEQNVYLTTVALSVLATGLLIAPVALHRALFRRHARRVSVRLAHRLAIAGIGFLGASVVAVAFLVFDVVHGRSAGGIAAAVGALVLGGLWWEMPWRIRQQHCGRGEPDRGAGA